MTLGNDIQYCRGLAGPVALVTNKDARMGKKRSFETPYKDLLPPLTTEERVALAADIATNGVHYPIAVDEDGNILDGHHRYELSDGKCEHFVVPGLSDAEKMAYVIRANFERRNLSPSQKDDLKRTTMKAIAKELRKEDPKKWTQVKVARALGVSQQTVSDWRVCPEDKPNTDAGNTFKTPPPPDARVKIPGEQKPVIAKRVAKGESQSQVAADYGVSQMQVSRIVNEETKAAEVKKARKAAAKKRKGNCGVLHGDFRKMANEIEDDSVDLILTDPPYNSEASATLYADLMVFAQRVLTSGGWVVAYSGKAHLPDVYASFKSAAKLRYAWTFCIVHQGGDARFRKFHLQTGWKPAVAGYKPKLQVDWAWFKDVLTCGARDKSDHPWQQAVEEAAYFIQRLCPEHGTVCDPFAGSGTTLLAAKRLKRKWVGVEKEKEHVETARSRLDDTEV